MTFPPDALLSWAAIAAVGLAFFGFAWLFVDAVDEGAGNYASAMGAETSRAFEEVFLFVSPAKIARLGYLAALAAFFLFFIPLFSLESIASTVAGIGLGLAAGAITFTLPGRYVRFQRERRRSVLLQQMRVGMGFEDALASLDRRVASDDLSLVCTAIDIARRTGGNLTEIFDRISDTIRARMRIERRVRTLTAQGRLQGIVVSLMPLVLGLAMFVLRPNIMKPFLFSTRGMVCVGAVLALIAVGWLLIRKIVRIDV